ncbi:MAG: hypothetical protein HZB39_18095 [Planctomycetes bacterium]|nr:hypothetical protein [Planctomycetota bacterium]
MVRYYDPDTGTEHFFGFGHVRVRSIAANEGVIGVATSSDAIGVGIGLGKESYGVSVGWDRWTRVIAAEDGSLRLEWPSADLLGVRLGSEPPANWSSSEPESSPQRTESKK